MTKEERLRMTLLLVVARLTESAEAISVGTMRLPRFARNNKKGEGSE